MARIDKWLYEVRLFKTRSLATAACNGGKIKLNGDNTKPAKELKVGDLLEMKRGLITRRYKVLDFPKGRISAKLAEQFLVDLTPETEILKLETMKLVSVVKREPGSGRPTKRERRDLDNLMDD